MKAAGGRASIALAALLCAGDLLAQQTPVPAPTPAPRRRPNVVLVLIDDGRMDDVAAMPRIQAQLAGEGVTFANAYVTDPLCCPSRTSILTGLLVHNHRVYGNEGPGGGEPGFKRKGHEEGNIALWLQSHGYTTMLGGKYLNAYEGDRVPPGWSEWDAIPTPPYPSSDHTDYLGAVAVDFIHRAREPWFAFVSAIPPHNPHIPTARHKNSLASRPFAPRKSYDEEDLRDKPAWVRGYPRISEAAEAQLMTEQQQRLESLLSVDEMVEAIIRALRETGRLENTYVVLTSDNGWYYGEHRLTSGKGTPYQEATNVPFMVRGPAVPKGKTLEHLVSLADLAPTFLELAGASAPEPLDGRSLVPLLTETPLALSEWRKAVLIEDESWEAVRTQDWVYIVSNEEELYDMRKDPYQLDNLFYWVQVLPEDRPAAFRDVKLPPELPEIRREFDRLLNCHGEGCR